MQWILQSFEDTDKLAHVLDRMGIAYSLHKVVPFVGTLLPKPAIPNPNRVVLFGSYTLWRYAQAHNLRPGVFTIRPYIHEVPWHPFLLNGQDVRFMTVREIAYDLPPTDQSCFIRPVSDSKEIAGTVMTQREAVAMAQKVMSVPLDDIPQGALRHETEMMLARPARIQKEWRLWIVNDKIVTYSLYKEGTRVVYRSEIDADVLRFAQKLVSLNPDYAPAYVMDVSRSDRGLGLIETNCVNAAGFYAADLSKLVTAIEAL